MDIYKSGDSQNLMDHYRNPRNRGTIVAANVVSTVQNPSCGDTIVIQGILTNGTLVQLNFTGSGCVISQAAASMLTELAIGKTVEELRALDAQAMRDLVGIPLGPTRLRCALLALEALHEGLAAYA
jgi:nitrogen fixation NifU-like protein